MNVFGYYSNIMSRENKQKFKLLMQEEQLLTEIKIISSNQELVDNLKNEFESKYHGYDFEYYLNILERCKKLLLYGINNFEDIKKIIYSKADYAILNY